ncbi:MAG: helix-turn-helix transcriptional regulator [Ruminococcaceae bacterium]|nr:helix-turn-helix transcriptional regulator [Oscillospiraceae bacterium]
MERTQLNNFCKNKVTRLDTDVLARICCALDCKIEDILEYIPPEDDNK